MSLLQWLSDGSLARGSRGRLSRRKQSDGRATASSTTAVMSADEEGRRSRGAGGTAFSRAKSRPRRTLPNLRSIFTRRHLRRGPLHVGSRRKQLGPRGRLHRCVVAPNPSSSGCHPARSAGLRPPLMSNVRQSGTWRSIKRDDGAKHRHNDAESRHASTDIHQWNGAYCAKSKSLCGPLVKDHTNQGNSHRHHLGPEPPRQSAGPSELQP